MPSGRSPSRTRRESRQIVGLGCNPVSESGHAHGPHVAISQGVRRGPASAATRPCARFDRVASACTRHLACFPVLNSGTPAAAAKAARRGEQIRRRGFRAVRRPERLARERVSSFGWPPVAPSGLTSVHKGAFGKARRGAGAMAVWSCTLPLPPIPAVRKGREVRPGRNPTTLCPVRGPGVRARTCR